MAGHVAYEKALALVFLHEVLLTNQIGYEQLNRTFEIFREDPSRTLAHEFPAGWAAADVHKPRVRYLMYLHHRLVLYSHLSCH